MNNPIVHWVIVVASTASVFVALTVAAQDDPIRPADPFAEIIDPCAPNKPLPTPKRAESKPGTYPIDFLQRQLAEALGKDWEITTTASTIAIRSRFQMQWWNQIGITPKDKDGKPANFARYEIAVAFTTPHVMYQEWEKLRAERDRLAHIVSQGAKPDPKRETDAKTEAFRRLTELDSFHVPAFAALHKERLLDIDVSEVPMGGWSAYFRSSDHPNLFFLPLATYQKCKAAEAIVKSYFIAYEM